MNTPIQRSLLLDTVLDAYHEVGVAADNLTIYAKVARVIGINTQDYVAKIGRAKSSRNTYHRAIRYAQQTLKEKGLVERLERGLWGITKKGKQTLTEIDAERHMIAFSSDLGVAVWGNALHVFGDTKAQKDDIHLCLTSPPYLGITRSYGTHHDEQAYIDFLLSVLLPIRERMAPGANLVLNMSNDSVLKEQFGERSLYLEKLILAVGEKLDLALMDRLVWHAPDKPPKGYQVTHKRTHLTSRYEPVLWFCNDPKRCLADNRRVLSSYSPQMQRLVNNNGESTMRRESDYQSNTRKGGFGRDNGGSIPSNVLTFPTRCNSNRLVINAARAQQLPVHGALYPVALAEHIISWQCPEGGLVVDPFGGYATTAWAAEKLERRWLTCELHWEYLRPALSRFIHQDGFLVNPAFTQLDNSVLRDCA
tara:strand:+ start:25652 stop:26914 length:1263 start_codon:yes stop_codon:yes gene_type:complete